MTDQGNVSRLTSITPTITPTLSDWYAQAIPNMSLEVLKRHNVDLEAKLDFVGNIGREEIESALKLIHARIDELLPKTPADVETHDHFNGDRIAQNWPTELSREAMRVHMHFCELVYAWKLNPARTSHGDATVDEFAESNGISRFIFESRGDAGDFIDHFGLEDFITTWATKTGASHPVTERPFWYIELTNKFAPSDVHEFLGAYNSAIMALSVIYDERRRAVSIDDGKFGFVTADHFTARENIELNKITAARQKLGLGFRALNSKDGQ